MENKLDVLAKKLYEEGVEKANQDAEKIVAEAREQAAAILEKAKEDAREIHDRAVSDVENLKKKADAEMSLSARQAITALRQAIADLISGSIASGIAKKAFGEENYIYDLLLNIVRKWDVKSGSLNLEVLLTSEEKDKFKDYVASHCKELLDKGLELNVGDGKERFVIKPKDAGYQISFSEELFEGFFNQYIRSFTKELLYKK